MRQMFIESRARAFNLEDDGMESGDERDSGLRTGSGSDTASPLVSEWENDCNCHAQLPPAHVSSGDVSLHRFVCSLRIDIRELKQRRRQRRWRKRLLKKEFTLFIAIIPCRSVCQILVILELNSQALYLSLKEGKRKSLSCV